MSAFKVGDVVVRQAQYLYTEFWEDVGWGAVKCEVVAIRRHGREVELRHPNGAVCWVICDRFELTDIPAVPAPHPMTEQLDCYQGHLPDGSSVQKHSAGPLYPCVLIFRDARLGREKYDVGVVTPRNQEPLWFSTFDAAVEVAQAIKKDLK